jgi:hypothetical protein
VFLVSRSSRRLSSASGDAAAHCPSLEDAAKRTWLGVIEAVTEAEAIENAAAEFGQYAKKLMAVPRS